MTTLSFSSVGFKPQFDYGDLPEALQTEAEMLKFNSGKHFTELRP